PAQAGLPPPPPGQPPYGPHTREYRAAVQPTTGHQPTGVPPRAIPKHAANGPAALAFWASWALIRPTPPAPSQADAIHKNHEPAPQRALQKGYVQVAAQKGHQPKPDGYEMPLRP